MWRGHCVDHHGHYEQGGPSSLVSMAYSPLPWPLPLPLPRGVVLESKSSVESIVCGSYNKTVNDIIPTLCRHLPEHLSCMAALFTSSCVSNQHHKLLVSVLYCTWISLSPLKSTAHKLFSNSNYNAPHVVQVIWCVGQVLQPKCWSRWRTWKISDNGNFNFLKFYKVKYYLHYFLRKGQVVFIVIPLSERQFWWWASAPWLLWLLVSYHRQNQP